MATKTYPLPNPAKEIGGPYQGSHGASAPNNWESRNAVDLAVPVGTPVYAIGAGVIGPDIGYQEGASQTGRFAGQRLHLTTGDNEFFYTHLSKLVVKAGEHVTDGQLLGYSGKANGVAHLHFAAKVGDPQEILAAQAAAPPNAGSAPDVSAPSAGSAGAAASSVPNPYSAPPPIQSGLAQPTALDPGTVPADGVSPRLYAETWQKIAADPWAPPEVNNYLSLWQGG